MAVLVCVGVVDPNLDFPLWGYTLGLLAAVILWAMLLRPCLRLRETEVELCNPFGSTHVPYARITSVEVGQVTRVTVGTQVHIGSGFGRSLRDMRTDRRIDADARPGTHSLGTLVAQRIERRVADTAAPGDDTPPVRVEREWLVIGPAVGLALLTIVLFLLR